MNPHKGLHENCEACAAYRAGEAFASADSTFDGDVYAHLEEAGDIPDAYSQEYVHGLFAGYIARGAK